MRSAGKLDLAIGIALGLILGLIVAYLLVIGIGSGRDSSGISTSPRAQPPAKEATNGPAREGSPAPPSQRR
jgi:hypothetical protein